jgi:hypothetical protein
MPKLFGREARERAREAGNNVGRKGKRDEAYPREWDAEQADEFTSGDLLILGDDGEQALFIPLTPPRLVEEKAFGTLRERMHIGVARVGSASVAPPDTWGVQDWPVAVRVFRRYRSIRSKYPEGFEGAVILRLVRDGASGSQETVYHLDVEQPVTPDVAGRVKELTAEAYAG